MSKKIIKKPLTIALGSALVGGLAATAASADVATDENPFAMEELNSSILIAGAHEEGGCGEDKDADDKDGGEGSCGEGKDEGEGKCGEGKCGGSA
ncbi:MAG: low-complexity protein [Gammaproteobacteria bacterium]|nr:low-complexity protein [Gammaproteobacteria bacterium]NND36859.1 low-complexity protein [Gammaproteobacteria bacterium]